MNIKPLQKKPSTFENVTLNKYGKEKYLKESSDKFGNNNVIISSEKQTKSGSSGKRKHWEIDVNKGIDTLTDKISSQRGMLGNNILEALDGYDDNTKFFHKEITILPVYIPPPKYSQH